MGRKRDAIEQLRTAIDCMPFDTRVAMIQGVGDNEIASGRYALKNMLSGEQEQVGRDEIARRLQTTN